MQFSTKKSFKLCISVAKSLARRRMVFEILQAYSMSSLIERINTVSDFKKKERNKTIRTLYNLVPTLSLFFHSLQGKRRGETLRTRLALVLLFALLKFSNPFMTYTYETRDYFYCTASCFSAFCGRKKWTYYFNLFWNTHSGYIKRII